jgi:riboflavin synthase
MSMFTGIVEEQGTVINLACGTRAGSLTIAARKVLEGVNLGDSIAVNGVCLTVTSFQNGQFSADVMPVTLEKTNLGRLSSGQPVNLERALQLQSRLGGHLVSGHIDAVGQIRKITPQENAILIEIDAPDQVKSVLIPQGSIAIDGISLTVAELTPQGFLLSIIPHTAEKTILGTRKVGDEVNLEGDLIGKYLYHFWQRATGNGAEMESSKLTRDFLAENGFF